MLIDLELKCTATHKWELVARFSYAELAYRTATALGAADGCSYRVTDRRWLEEPIACVYTDGAQVGPR